MHQRNLLWCKKITDSSPFRTDPSIFLGVPSPHIIVTNRLGLIKPSQSLPGSSFNPKPLKLIEHFLLHIDVDLCLHTHLSLTIVRMHVYVIAKYCVEGT
ncbi:hypothetical protein [Pseudomonas fluorescens]|uniref:Uncharacterized protein n=1 Tax=Pseudomonas fluorescens TaxID=294 RepID=A0A5E7KZ18_PSEFL|nr:hypothetical protein [Pseudomonas fluorescens]VVP06181.1 hypothetical protein PS880_03075 [Pseudomonas fluorescens]